MPCQLDSATLRIFAEGAGSVVAALDILIDWLVSLEDALQEVAEGGVQVSPSEAARLATALTAVEPSIERARSNALTQQQHFLTLAATSDAQEGGGGTILH